jgi:hypothetical protein
MPEFFDGVLIKHKQKTFDFLKSKFIHRSYLLANELFGMVFEYLQNSFHPKDLANSFFKLFLVCSYVIIRHIFGSIT